MAMLSPVYIIGQRLAVFLESSSTSDAVAVYPYFSDLLFIICCTLSSMSNLQHSPKDEDLILMKIFVNFPNVTLLSLLTLLEGIFYLLC